MTGVWQPLVTYSLEHGTGSEEHRNLFLFGVINPFDCSASLLLLLLHRKFQVKCLLKAELGAERSRSNKKQHCETVKRHCPRDLGSSRLTG